MDNVKEFKKELRRLIDKHSNVSKVAQLMGVAQSSLSRMLNSPNQVSEVYLNKLLDVLKIKKEDIIITKVMTVNDIEKYKKAIIELVNSSYYINVIDVDMLTDITLEIVQKLYNLTDLDKDYIKLSINKDLGSN